MKVNIEVIKGKVYVDREFVWGPVVKVHDIGEYSIVEFHPQLFKNCCGTGEYEKERTEFHPYINGKDTCRGFNSLDEALIGTICYKNLGGNERLSDYLRIIFDSQKEGE